MQGNKFSEAPPGLNWVRRLDPRTKLCLLLTSFVMVLLPESPQVVALATLMVLGVETSVKVSCRIAALGCPYSIEAQAGALALHIDEGGRR